MERGSVGTALIGTNTLLREVLAHILKGADFQVLASASRVDESIVASLPQDHALLIIEAGGNIDSTVHQIEAFKGHCPAGRVVVLAHQLELPEIVLAFKAGANAYLVTVAACDVFVKTLELVMLGETVLPSSLLSLLSNTENVSEEGNGALDHYDNGISGHGAHITDEHADHDDDTDDDVVAAGGSLSKGNRNKAGCLSARERLILRCLIDGDPNKTIARKIHVTEGTVKVHVKAILRKIRVHNRTQAAIWAMNNRSFIPVKDYQSSAMPKLSIQPFPGLASRRASSPRAERPASLPLEIEIGNSHDEASASYDNVVRRVIEPKCC
jgi:two-component system, NarL family, nitrate/nitrite response regulator NarL